MAIEILLLLADSTDYVAIHRDGEIYIERMTDGALGHVPEGVAGR